MKYLMLILFLCGCAVHKGGVGSDLSIGVVETASLKTDNVVEKSSGVGVTVDGVNLKDGKLTTTDSVDANAIAANAVGNAELADTITIPTLSATTLNMSDNITMAVNKTVDGLDVSTVDAGYYTPTRQYGGYMYEMYGYPTAVQLAYQKIKNVVCVQGYPDMTRDAGVNGICRDTAYTLPFTGTGSTDQRYCGMMFCTDSGGVSRRARITCFGSYFTMNMTSCSCSKGIGSVKYFKLCYKAAD